MLLAHTFCDVQMGIEPLMEPYNSWFHEQDLRRSYAYYADLLRMNDWQRPGQRWLLKSPAHLLALDVLIEMFPDVSLVVTHRSPLEILPSYCSMMDTLMVAREDFDRKELGPLVLESLAVWLERAIAVRDASDPARFYDVDYYEFVADPMTTVRGIYAHFGLDFPAESEAQMQAWADENRQGKHGVHDYEMDRYGLTPERVTSRLGAYLDRYELPTE